MRQRWEVTEREDTSFAKACRRCVSVGFAFSLRNPKRWFIFCSTWIQIQLDNLIKPGVKWRHFPSLKITHTVVSILRNRSSPHQSFYAWRQMGGGTVWHLRESLPAEPKRRSPRQHLQLPGTWEVMFLLDFFPHLNQRHADIWEESRIPSLCHWLICLNELHVVSHHRPVGDSWDKLVSAIIFWPLQGQKIINIAEEVRFWALFRMM